VGAKDGADGAGVGEGAAGVDVLVVSSSGRPQLGPETHQTGDTAPWQILDVNLFRRFLLTQDEFWHDTRAIGSSMKFCFQPYIERTKPSPYATWASVLLRTTPGLRTGLELELLLASTSEARIGSTLDLLLDLENLAGLHLLQSMHHAWT
jgi:hypothetical protein